MTSSNEALREALADIEQSHCGCNAMRGYTCGIHARVSKIRNLLAVPPAPTPARDIPGCTADALAQGGTVHVSEEPTLREALEEVRELISGYVDVKDSENEPLPNDAMRATQILDGLIKQPGQSAQELLSSKPGSSDSQHETGGSIAGNQSHQAPAAAERFDAETFVKEILKYAQFKVSDVDLTGRYMFIANKAYAAGQAATGAQPTAIAIATHWRKCIKEICFQAHTKGWEWAQARLLEIFKEAAPAPATLNEEQVKELFQRAKVEPFLSGEAMFNFWENFTAALNNALRQAVPARAVGGGAPK